MRHFHNLRVSQCISSIIHCIPKLQFSHHICILYLVNRTGKIECVQICGPLRSGLVQNPVRFAIKGNRPETIYPGLFICGADLTVADSTSGGLVGGWMAANAIMGYSFIDHLYIKKNITSDLQQFLEEPSLATVRDGVIIEDLAVPFNEKLSKKANEGEGVSSTAESTKEE